MRSLLIVCGFIISAACGINVMAQGEASSASGEVAEKCGSKPAQPSIPNGSNATEAELVAVQGKVKDYMKLGSTYRQCILELEAGWKSEEDKAKQQVAIILHDSSVDDEQQVGELFNAAVRAFKAK